MSELLRRVTDPTTTESQLTQAVVTGAVTAVLSPARLSPTLVRATPWGMGVLGAAGGAAAVGDHASWGQRGVAAGIAGSAVASISWVGIVLDQGLESWLRKAGVRRPRVVIGVLSGVATYAVARAQARSATPYPSREE